MNIKTCINCKIHNPEEALFCRFCGQSFKTQVPTLIEKEDVRQVAAKWKRYSYWKRPITGVVLRIFLSCILAIVVVVISSILLQFLCQDKELSIIVSIVVGLGFLIVGFYYTLRLMPNKQEKEFFSKAYDKIEPYYYIGIKHSRNKRLYKIFVKDYKMGLMDVTNYKIAIKPHYQMMEWANKQSVLKVKLNGDSFKINIKGDFV